MSLGLLVQSKRTNRQKMRIRRKRIPLPRRAPRRWHSLLGAGAHGVLVRSTSLLHARACLVGTLTLAWPTVVSAAMIDSARRSPPRDGRALQVIFQCCRGHTSEVPPSILNKVPVANLYSFRTKHTSVPLQILEHVEVPGTVYLSTLASASIRIAGNIRGRYKIFRTTVVSGYGPSIPPDLGSSIFGYYTLAMLDFTECFTAC